MGCCSNRMVSAVLGVTARVTDNSQRDVTVSRASSLSERLLDDEDIRTLIDVEERLVILIHGDVYDVTGYAALHPGGMAVLKHNVGKEVGHVFDRIHRLSTRAQIAQYRIGRLHSAGPRHVSKPLRKNVDAPSELIRATVLNSEVLSEDIMRITIASPVELQHPPGGYIRIRACQSSASCTRVSSHTIASVAETSFTLIVKRGSNNQTVWDLCSLQPGGEVEYEGPYAPAWVADNDKELYKTPEVMRRVTFLAGGVGVIPVFSLVKDLLEKQIASATLVVSTQNLSTLVIRDQIADLAVRYGSSQLVDHPITNVGVRGSRKALTLWCIFTRSLEEVSVPGANVVSYTRLDHETLSKFGRATTVVICGSPGFTRAAKEASLKGGVCGEDRIVIL